MAARFDATVISTHNSDAKVFRSNGVTDMTYTLHVCVCSIWVLFCHIVKNWQNQVSCKIVNEEYGYVMSGLLLINHIA